MKLEIFIGSFWKATRTAARTSLTFRFLIYGISGLCLGFGLSQVSAGFHLGPQGNVVCIYQKKMMMIKKNKRRQLGLSRIVLVMMTIKWLTNDDDENDYGGSDEGGVNSDYDDDDDNGYKEMMITKTRITKISWYSRVNY